MHNRARMTVASRIVGLLAKLPPPATGNVAVERDMATKMTDGVVLLADRWYPVGYDLPPTVLMRSPYGRKQVGVVGRIFAERGYQCVIQSCRGTFGSAGEWLPFRNEQADGMATLHWISAQPWFGGKLATFGPSYLGLTQWALTQGCPGYLRAMALDVTASDFRDAVVYPSDTFALEMALTWIYQLENQERGGLRSLAAQIAGRRALKKACAVLPVSDADSALVGRKVSFFQDWLDHESPEDGWWDPIRFGQDLTGVPPTSHVAGWYDIFLPRQLDDFVALRAAGKDVRLTVGPWSHVSPGGLAAMLRDGIQLFDTNISDEPTHSASSAVRLFVMGSKRWVELSDWPPSSQEERWYLHAGAKLDRSLPTGSAADRYRFDLRDPTPAAGEHRSIPAAPVRRISAGARAGRTFSRTRAMCSSRTSPSSDQSEAIFMSGRTLNIQISSSAFATYLFEADPRTSATGSCASGPELHHRPETDQFRSASRCGQQQTPSSVDIESGFRSRAVRIPCSHETAGQGSRLGARQVFAWQTRRSSTIRSTLHASFSRSCATELDGSHLTRNYTRRASTECTSPK